MDENNRNTEKLISDEQARELLRSFRPRGSSDNASQRRNSPGERGAQHPVFRREFSEPPKDIFRSDYEDDEKLPDVPSVHTNAGSRFNQRSRSSAVHPNEVDALPVRNYNRAKNTDENANDIGAAMRNRNPRITDAIIVDEADNAEKTNNGYQAENDTYSDLDDRKRIPIKVTALVLTLLLFSWLLPSGSVMNLTKVSLSSNDRHSIFESSSNNLLSEAMNEIHAIPRTYTLGMGEYLTPAPDKTKFTRIEDGERKNYDGSPIDYYKDETIEVKCWKEKTSFGIITYAEVWIAHPSQFRRTLVDNVISKNHLDHPQNIFAKTNGVLGMSGDYCAYRPYGIEILYGNLVRDKVGSHLSPKMDILVYDTDGNFSVYESKKEFFNTEVYTSGKIIHTLAFGPMLIDDYKVSSKKDKLYKYQNGRPWEKWPRAAICQFDYDKHYLLCRLGQPGAVMEDFAKEIHKKGVRLAYALDGGQTGTIMFNKKIVNEPAFDGTRAISDIIYFATAVPDD